MDLRDSYQATLVDAIIAHQIKNIRGANEGEKDAGTDVRYWTARGLCQDIRKLSAEKKGLLESAKVRREEEELMGLQDALKGVSIGPPSSILENWYQCLQGRSTFGGGLEACFPGFRRKMAEDGGQLEEFACTFNYSGLSLPLRILQHCPQHTEGCKNSDGSCCHQREVKIAADMCATDLNRLCQLVLQEKPAEHLVNFLRDVMQTELATRN